MSGPRNPLKKKPQICLVLKRCHHHQSLQYCTLFSPNSSFPGSAVVSSLIGLLWYKKRKKRGHTKIFWIILFPDVFYVSRSICVCVCTWNYCCYHTMGSEAGASRLKKKRKEVVVLQLKKNGPVWIDPNAFTVAEGFIFFRSFVLCRVPR